MQAEDLTEWQACPSPAHHVITGRTCRLEPLDPSTHAEALVQAHSADPTGSNWTYLFSPAPKTPAETENWVRDEAQAEDRLSYAVVETAKQRATGSLAFMRIDPLHGSIEIGCVLFSPELQRTTPATEAVYLLAAQAFELGYRRLEWKCHSENLASRRAASRLGFTFEGIFRQHMVVKGLNRDSAWFSIIDHEWPRIAASFQAWLAPENFDSNGQQRSPLNIQPIP